nr:MAG TPA: Protealysin propeptide [Bacteriophage sp.]
MFLIICRCYLCSTFFTLMTWCSCCSIPPYLLDKKRIKAGFYHMYYIVLYPT